MDLMHKISKSEQGSTSAPSVIFLVAGGGFAQNEHQPMKPMSHLP